MAFSFCKKASEGADWDCTEPVACFRECCCFNNGESCNYDHGVSFHLVFLHFFPSCFIVLCMVNPNVIDKAL